MRPRSLVTASLRYHWPSHIAVILGVACATAVLCGALLVGDSMRGSLRNLALSRLGPITDALSSPNRFVSVQTLEQTLESNGNSNIGSWAPVLQSQAGVRATTSGLSVNQTTVYGVDDRFWKLASTSIPAQPSANSIVLNETLARDLAVHTGDDLVVRLPKPAAVPVESLLGRPSETAISIRFTVSAILPTQGLDRLALHPTPSAPRNAFVPLALLQKQLKQLDRANTALLVAKPGSQVDLGHLNDQLARSMTLGDYGLKLHGDEKRAYTSLESSQLLIEPPVERALDHSNKAGLSTTPVITYLINDIAIDRGPQTEPGVPYSVGSALDFSQAGVRDHFHCIDRRPCPTLGADDLILNDWTADDLHAKIGDRITLTYFVTKGAGRLETIKTILALRGIVRMTDWGDDAGLSPEYEGITNAKTLGEWNPPFPLDLKRIRKKDDAYWEAHKATPKVFVSLDAGLRMWGEADQRFGRFTAMRLIPSDTNATTKSNLATATSQFQKSLLENLHPADVGLSFAPVRQQAIEASTGSTDFGMLFLGFSFFLIIAAAMLIALFFRLGIERRARELGILFATGYTTKRVKRIFMSEGALLTCIGTAIGVPASFGYTWLMLAGLRTWWSGAANVTDLTMHVSATNLAIGIASGLFIAILSIRWTLRGLGKLSPRALLAGSVVQVRASQGSGKLNLVMLTIGSAAFAGQAITLAVSPSAPRAALFFGSGASLLMVTLASFSWWMRRQRRPLMHGGQSAILRLGIRNAVRHPGRSALSAGLVACASFLIVSVGANRQTVTSHDKSSGTGGFALFASSNLPIPFDLTTAKGRDDANITPQTHSLLDRAKLFSLRVSPGDDASCLNPYQARRPRILAATDSLIERGGFTFASSQAKSGTEKANPWTLLRRTSLANAIPAIGDENTVRWLLHLDIGQTLEMNDERGQPIRLLVVGMLEGSILQGELMIGEAAFKRHFPSVGGASRFLIECDAADKAPLRKALETDLRDYLFEATPADQRLAELMAVENTYLSVFALLGGFGLILGSIGLGAVMLRNVLERQSEFGLLQALGFRSRSIAAIVLSESGALLMGGLLAGAISGLVALGPQQALRLSWSTGLLLGAVLGGVLIIGMSSVTGAVRMALRTSVIAALRSE